jgi:hypothetical protein
MTEERSALSPQFLLKNVVEFTQYKKFLNRYLIYTYSGRVRRLQNMERSPILMDWQNQHSKNSYTTK